MGRRRAVAPSNATETVVFRHGGAPPFCSRPPRPHRGLAWPSLCPTINGRPRSSQHLCDAPIREYHAVMRGLRSICRGPTHDRTPSLTSPSSPPLSPAFGSVTRHAERASYARLAPLPIDKETPKLGQRMNSMCPRRIHQIDPKSWPKMTKPLQKKLP